MNDPFQNNLIDWRDTYAAIWRPRRDYLRPVRQLDAVKLSHLVGIDAQKQQLLANTERFIAGMPANNALLWGARGTGKSSLVKAVLNEYKDRSLRLIEVEKYDLVALPEIVDQIRELPYYFIIFCDDLSFDAADNSYKALKSALEGSIEAPPKNVLVYATSNRRHLLPESMADNLESRMVEGELHYADAIEEKISLSDRFGLWLSFYSVDQDTYLAMVDEYFKQFSGDRSQLHLEAKRFALSKGSRSGRTAKQFYNFFSRGEGK